MNGTGVTRADDHVDVVRRIMADMSVGDAALFGSVMAENIVYHLTDQHRFAGVYREKATILDLLDSVRSNFESGIRYEIERI